MFQYILFICVTRLRGERTVSGIYHLLTGKRSSQSLQDSRSYRLDQFFGVYPSLNRERFQQYFEKAEREGFIVINNNQYPVITEKGKVVVQQYKDHNFYFDGMKKHQSIQMFEERVFLLIQTTTNIHINNYTFLPVTDHKKIQNWVKKAYFRHQKDLTLYVRKLYEEIDGLLSHRPVLEAELFTYRLTGGPVIGLTRDQLAKKFAVEKEEVDIKIHHLFYYFYHQIDSQRERYPLLYQCIADLKPSTLITHSAKRTYELLEQGDSIKEISAKRNLKESTIQDHVVEAALVIPDFSIDRFIDVQDQRFIVDQLKQLKTMKLKTIYEALEGQYSYFTLRLVLASVQQSSEERRGNYAKP
ncbi:helix-turn-helix domain-containing protein [Halobacillus rhizosphaerae]|uniref:helix-turn-helix domain-containing protein n=1 Tax=Halobacillus rhizosphaerae TaxID=3064889 RepID=UPI00398ABFD7